MAAPEAHHQILCAVIKLKSLEYQIVSQPTLHNVLLSTIDLGGLGQAMTDVVADGLQGELCLDQALHTGMTKGMGAGPDNSDARVAQTTCRQLGDRWPT